MSHHAYRTHTDEQDDRQEIDEANQAKIKGIFHSPPPISDNQRACPRGD
jgi:hypothetical protein